MSRFPLVYIVQKDAAGNVVPIPAEGLLLENLTPEGGRLRTDGEGRALELPPSLLEYAAAHQKPMRRAGVRNVRTTITLREAGRAYPSFASANEKFGKLARMIAEDLSYMPDRRADGSPIWTMTLATGADPRRHEDDGLWRWTMRPQVAECLLRMNLGDEAV